MNTDFKCEVTNSMSKKISDRIYASESSDYLVSKFHKKSARMNTIDLSIEDLQKRINELHDEKFMIGRDLLFLHDEIDRRGISPSE